MIKNQKGVTIITLTITIIVLLIISSVVIVTSLDLIKSSNMRNYITVMSLMTVEIEKRFEDFEFENDVKDMTLPELDVSKLEIIGSEKYDLEDDEKIPLQNEMSDQEKNMLIDKTTFEEDSNNDGEREVDVDNLWYKLSTTTLEELKIEYGTLVKEDEYFIINYATGEVIFSTGFETEDNIKLFSLTGLKELN